MNGPAFEPGRTFAWMPFGVSSPPIAEWSGLNPVAGLLLCLAILVGSVLLLLRARALANRARLDQIGAAATELIRVTNALRECEERLRQVFDDCPVGMYRAAPDGRILSVNAAALHLIGCPSADEFV